MKWRNERGDTSTDSTFLIGAILLLTILALTAVAGEGIAGALAGVGA